MLYPLNKKSTGRPESSVAYLQATAAKDARDPGYLQRRQPPPCNCWDSPVPKFAAAPVVETMEPSIPLHATKSAQHASHASDRAPLTGGVAELCAVETAAGNLSAETYATTPSTCDQPTEDSGTVPLARSTQVVKENLRGTLRGLLGLGRLREEEEERRKEEVRRETTPFTGSIWALTRRYPGTI